MLALALLDVLASAEGPLFLRVRFADFFAGVAATGFYDGLWGRRTAAFAAVIRVQVFGFVAVVASGLVVGRVSRLNEWIDFGDLQLQGLDIQDTTAICGRAHAHLIHTMYDTNLLFAGDVHHVEGQELARKPREGHVQVDFHSLACIAKELSALVSSYWRESN